MPLKGTEREVQQEATKIEKLYKESQEAGNGDRDSAINAFQNEVSAISRNNPAFFRRVCNQIQKDDAGDDAYDVSVEYDGAGNPTHLQFNPGVWNKVWNGQRSVEKTLEDRYTKTFVDTLGYGGDSLMSNFTTLMEKNNQNIDVVAEKLKRSLAGTGVDVSLGTDDLGQRTIILNDGDDSVSLSEISNGYEGNGQAGLRETLNNARQQRQQDSAARDREMTQAEIDQWFKDDRQRRQRRGH